MVFRHAPIPRKGSGINNIEQKQDLQTFHLLFALRNVDCYQSEILPQHTLNFHLN